MSHTVRMTAIAVTSALLLAIGGAWLSLSYVGVISRDVRVNASVVSFGDGLAPGAKVRFHGLIVGTVHNVAPGDSRLSAQLLIESDKAATIPRNVTARVLPSTLFGTDYVELVGPATDASAGAVGATFAALRSGDTIEADRSAKTIRLMETFDSATKLIGAIDARQMNDAIGSVASALDGHGEDLGSFVERADHFVATLNANEDLFYGDLDRMGTAANTVTAMEPHLTSALNQSGTTANTVVARRSDIDSLFTTGTGLSQHTSTLLDRDADTLILLLKSIGPSLGLFADHSGDLAKILTGVPTVLHNGANGVNDHAIKMIGKIALDPLEPYTAADCTRYGSLAGSNCGAAGPPKASSSHDAPGKADDATALQQKIEDLLAKAAKQQIRQSAPTGYGPSTGTTPGSADDANPLGEGLDLMLQMFLQPLFGKGATP